MKTSVLLSWLSPLAVALLAFGSQVAFAQEASTLTREEVRAEALQAQKSGALERQRITSYSINPDWGPGAAANTSQSARALAARKAAAGVDSPADVQSKKNPGTRTRDPV